MNTEKLTMTATSRNAEAKIGDEVSIYIFSSNRTVAGTVVAREEKIQRIGNGYGGFKKVQVVTLTIQTGN